MMSAFIQRCRANKYLSNNVRTIQIYFCGLRSDVDADRSEVRITKGQNLAAATRQVGDGAAEAAAREDELEPDQLRTPQTARRPLRLHPSLLHQHPVLVLRPEHAILLKRQVVLRSPQLALRTSVLSFWMKS